MRNHTPPPEEDTPAETEPMATEDETAANRPKKLDLVFTMDCTGSMGSYINSAKTNIEAIVRKLVSEESVDLRFGLVAYRDHPPQDTSFVTRRFPFTRTLEAMHANLAQLSANGGGDGPEAVEAGLLDTLNMDWRDDAAKVCVLIADAPPHGLGETSDGFPAGAPTGVDPLAVLERMSAGGICIYSVGCQPALSHYRFAVDFFVAAAEKTNGQAVSLGSAAALADVILGGSIEECDLQGLMQDMQQQVAQLRERHPAMDEEEVQTHIYQTYQSRGTKTRQMKAAKLASPYSKLVTEASSLDGARACLASAAPPPPSPFEKFKRSLSRRGRASAPPPPPGAMPPAPMAFAAASMPMPAAAPFAGMTPPSMAPPPPPGAMPPAPMAFAAASMPMPAAAPFAGMAPPSMAPAAAKATTETVELEEADISYDQVKRMYGRSKKMGHV